MFLRPAVDIVPERVSAYILLIPPFDCAAQSTRGSAQGV